MQKLVQIVSEIINTAAVYKKVPTCAYDIGTFTVSNNGAFSWTEDTNVEMVKTVVAGPQFKGLNAKEERQTIKKANAPKQPQEQPDKLTVEIPRKLMNDTALANLDRIIKGKGTLIKKAIGVDSLKYEITEDRIRFPWFTMTKDTEENKAYITFISKLAEHMRTVKRVTPKDKPVDNEKYAFRCFLLQLGFIGEEYKQARKILLKNLTGNGAWKNGDAH